MWFIPFPVSFYINAKKVHIYSFSVRDVFDYCFFFIGIYQR